MGKIVRYKMEMEVLTPVHIAGADYKSKLNKNEYIYKDKDKKLILIDRDKFVNFLIKKNLFEEYLSYINEETELKSLTNFLDKNQISEKEFIKKIYNEVYIGKGNDITLLNRSIENKIYIPGSSIKGALINLLLVSYIIKNRDEFINEIKQIENEIENFDKDDFKFFQKKVKNIINKVQEKILYENCLNKEIKKLGISISDSYKNKKDIKINFYQDIDEKIKDKKKNSLPVIVREYIEPKNIFEFDITLDFELLSRTRLKINDFDDLINALEEATDYLIENTLELPDELCCQNLILGANTGFHQKTIVHALFKDKSERTQVVKILLHKGGTNAIRLHLNDKDSPRVINRIRKNGKLELAGLVEIRKISEKEVGK